jgi:Flp pilus assembly protein TadB
MTGDELTAAFAASDREWRAWWRGGTAANAAAVVCFLVATVTGARILTVIGFGLVAASWFMWTRCQRCKHRQTAQLMEALADRKGTDV